MLGGTKTVPSHDTTVAPTQAKRPEEYGQPRLVVRGVLFVLIGLLLYAGAYGLSESLVYRTTEENPFFKIKIAPLESYDFVISGASHGMPLGFADMNDYLQEVTESTVLNVSAEGVGVVVTDVILDYFLIDHHAKNVIYFLDSFTFYSSEWNEVRLRDSWFYKKAPFDMRLGMLLLKKDWRVALGYLTGFSKINNKDRFKSDITDAEATKFNTVYRPVASLDKRRMSYLYPAEIDTGTFEKYLALWEDMVRDLNDRNIHLIVIKSPISDRVYEMMPGEAEFDRRIQEMLSQYDAEFHDFAHVNNDNKLFYNTDHLNKTGTRSFIDGYMKDVMTSAAGR